MMVMTVYELVVGYLHERNSFLNPIRCGQSQGTFLNPMRCGQSQGTLVTFIDSQFVHCIPLTLFLHSCIILFAIS